jgi:hypothetical protein
MQKTCAYHKSAFLRNCRPLEPDQTALIWSLAALYPVMASFGRMQVGSTRLTVNEEHGGSGLSSFSLGNPGLMGSLEN